MEFDYSVTDSVIPFGKFKGTKIKDLPIEYLSWWMKEENIRKLKDPLIRFAIAAAHKKKTERIEGIEGKK